jgi:two-component system response regulator VicR
MLVDGFADGARTILLVEDDGEIRDIIGDLLERDGYDVIPAGNGKQAIDYLAARQELPALILLDLMMPIVSGWEFLRAISQDPRTASIPVVVITAVRGDRPHGVAAVLKKPFGVDDIVAAVRRFAAPAR